MEPDGDSSMTPTDPAESVAINASSLEAAGLGGVADVVMASLAIVILNEAASRSSYVASSLLILKDNF